jgi:hypothetical protein
MAANQNQFESQHPAVGAVSSQSLAINPSYMDDKDCCLNSNICGGIWEERTNWVVSSYLYPFHTIYKTKFQEPVFDVDLA